MSERGDLKPWEKFIALFFTSAILTTLIIFLFFPPSDINPITAAIISFLSAIAAGYSGYLFAGEIEGVLPFSKGTIQTTGASATFLIVLVLFLNFLGGYVGNGDPEGGDPEGDDPINSLPPSVSMSYGEKALTEPKGSEAAKRKEAIENFATYFSNQDEFSGNLYDARDKFQEYLGQNKNDPEARIYLNNAIAEINSRSTNNLPTIRVAVNVPISADLDLSAEILRGVAQAQMEINESNSLNGGLLEILIADDEDNIDVAKALAEKLAEQADPILAAIGHYSSTLTEAVQNIYQANKIILISPSATSTTLSRDDISYFFRTATSDEVASKQLAKYAEEELEIDDVSVAYVYGDEYGESLENNFFNSLNQRSVSQCDLASKGFNAKNNCVEEAIKGNAEAFLLIPKSIDYMEEALAVVQALNGRMKLLGGDSMYNSKIDPYKKQLFDGDFTAAIPWHRKGCKSPEKQAFEEGACKLWGDNNINWRSATAYDAIQAFAEAIRREYAKDELSTLAPASSDLVEQFTSGLVEQFADSNFEAKGATGSIRFENKGDRKDTDEIGILVQLRPIETNNPETQEQNGSDSTIEYDFVQI